MRFRDPFTLFPKKLDSGRVIYYYTTYDHFNRRKQFSTGQNKRSKARAYCLQLFKEDELVRFRDMKMKDYVKDWFIYDKCPHIRSILNTGNSYTKNVAVNKRLTLERHIIPFFGNLYMTEIKTLHIEEWISQLKEMGKSNNTINAYIQTMRTILNYAHRAGDIKNNPIGPVKKFAKEKHIRTTLTEKEVVKLFDENNKNSIWIKEVYYLMTLVASQTGMRMGEIQALKMENVHKDHIVVKYGWDRKYGIRGTKTGETRIVPISLELYNRIEEYNNKTASELIFVDIGENKPMAYKNIGVNFYSALKKIGINEKQRKERNITFHSWRHYYNTRLIKKGVPTPIVQAILGHSNDGRMTKNYTKLTKDDLVNSIRGIK